MYNIINICLVCVCYSIIIMTENEVELSYGRAIYERIDLLDLLDDDLSDIYIITGYRQSLRKCACTCGACVLHVQCTFTVIVTVHCTMKMSWLLLPLCLSVERSQLLHGASVYHNIISDFVSKCSVCRVCCALSIGSQVETCRPPWQ